MTFDEYLAEVGTEKSTVHIRPDWMQGRACYGGLVAALVFQSMRSQISRPLPVRCLQISFVGPVDESPLTLSSEVLREGKNVAHVLGRGEQNGQTKVIVQGSFGAPRESIIDLPVKPLVLDGDITRSNRLPYIEGVIPEFTRKFEFQYLTPFPFAGGDKPYLEGRLRFNEAPNEISEAHLLGLLDAWPPTTLPLMKKLCMASSLSWTVEFIHPRPLLGVDEYTSYRADIIDSQNGYGYTRATMANAKGEVLAVSQQSITHFG